MAKKITSKQEEGFETVSIQDTSTDNPNEELINGIKSVNSTFMILAKEIAGLKKNFVDLKERVDKLYTPESKQE